MLVDVDEIPEFDSSGSTGSHTPPDDSPLPAVVSSAHLELYRRELDREHRPASFTEMVIVRDMACRAAYMESLRDAAAALQREGARALSEVTLPLGGNTPVSEDTLLAGTVAGGRFDEVFRQGLGNARAFYRALSELRKLKSERRKVIRVEGHDERFNTEEACRDYLLRRFQQGTIPCRRCGKTGHGSWLAQRRCWECGKCKAQMGIRAGTVMERSPLTLTAWFTAVRVLLLQPTISVADLAAKAGIQRIATVRGMARKIRTAMESDQASELLAGLDVVYK